MAGIQNHQIRGTGVVDLDDAERSQRIRHPHGVVDIHLAAIGLDATSDSKGSDSKGSDSKGSKAQS
jgi:hypothetical protein